MSSRDAGGDPARETSGAELDASGENLVFKYADVAPGVMLYDQPLRLSYAYGWAGMRATACLRRVAWAGGNGTAPASQYALIMSVRATGFSGTTDIGAPIAFAVSNAAQLREVAVEAADALVESVERLLPTGETALKALYPSNQIGMTIWHNVEAKARGPHGDSANMVLAAFATEKLASDFIQDVKAEMRHLAADDGSADAVQEAVTLSVVGNTATMESFDYGDVWNSALDVLDMLNDLKSGDAVAAKRAKV